MGYLSHDYWPSLLCINDNRDYVRFFNLTNTRNQGSFRYYRCSKCTSLKTSAPTNLFNFDFYNKKTLPSPDKLLAQFSVPKIQINGMTIVTDLSKLCHHPDCQPISIPAMIADQLDRRARRQVSLGLLEPRDAWNQAYLEAVRISPKVARLHPGFENVADIFPPYEVARVQYSRHFHKNNRRLSQTIEDNISTSIQRRNTSKLDQSTNNDNVNAANKNNDDWACCYSANHQNRSLINSNKHNNIKTQRNNSNSLHNFYSQKCEEKIASCQGNLAAASVHSVDINMPSHSNDYVIVDGYYDCDAEMCLLESKESLELCEKLYSNEKSNDSLAPQNNYYETYEEVLILEGNEESMEEGKLTVYECDDSSFLLTRPLTPGASPLSACHFDEMPKIDSSGNYTINVE